MVVWELLHSALDISFSFLLFTCTFASFFVFSFLSFFFFFNFFVFLLLLLFLEPLVPSLYNTDPTLPTRTAASDQLQHVRVPQFGVASNFDAAVPVTVDGADGAFLAHHRQHRV